MRKFALKLWVLVAVLMALSAMLLPVGGLLGMRSEPWFPIRDLRIRGPLKRLSADELRAALDQEIRLGMFAFSPARAREAIERLPWVERAEVRKVWPDQLMISYRESTAVARWGDAVLITEQGQPIVTPEAQTLSDMPMLIGPDARKPELVKLYKQIEPSLKAEKFELREMRLSEGGSVLLTLGDGLVIDLGSEDFRNRWQRFTRALPNLRSDAKDRGIRRVDTRYPHGLAVQFGVPDAAQASEQLAKAEVAPW
jgi:cell division protein FtsQ